MASHSNSLPADFELTKGFLARRYLIGLIVVTLALTITGGLDAVQAPSAFYF